MKSDGHLRSSNRPIEFVGREHELESALACISNVLRGNSHILFISGEAGIGKTRLIMEIERLAKVSNFTGISYSFDSNASSASGQVGSIIDLASKISGHLPIILGHSQEVLGDALLEQLRSISSNRPLFLILDDAQRCDTGSWSLITFALRNLGNSPVLVVIGHRTGGEEEFMDQSRAIRDSKRVFFKGNRATEIPLKSMNRMEVNGIIGNYLKGRPDDRLINTIEEQSAGNPLFMIELLKNLKNTKMVDIRNDLWTIKVGMGFETPPILLDIVKNKIDAMPEEYQHDVWALSCIADIADLGHIPQLLEQEETHFMRELDDINSIYGLFKYDDDGWRFSHDIYRAAAAESIPKELAVEYHRFLGVVREQDYHGSSDDRALSWHFYQGELWPKSTHYSLLAGSKALEEESSYEASELLNRALKSYYKSGSDELQKLARIFEKLGDAHKRLTLYDSSLSMYGEALDLMNDGSSKVRVLRKIAYCQIQKEYSEESMRTAEGILNTANNIECVSDDERAELYSYWAILDFYKKDIESCISKSKVAFETFRVIGENEKAIWELVNQINYYCRPGRIEEARDVIRKAMGKIDEKTSRIIKAQYHIFKAEVAMYEGSFDEAISDLDEAIGINYELGYFSDLSTCYWFRGLIRSLHGKHELALSDGYSAKDYGDLEGLDVATVRAETLLAHSCIALGRLEEAHNAIERASSSLDIHHGEVKFVGYGFYLISKGELLESQGKLREGQILIETGFEFLEGNPNFTLFSSFARRMVDVARTI